MVVILDRKLREDIEKETNHCVRCGSVVGKLIVESMVCSKCMEKEQNGLDV